MHAHADTIALVDSVDEEVGHCRVGGGEAGHEAGEGVVGFHGDGVDLSDDRGIDLDIYTIVV